MPRNNIKDVQRGELVGPLYAQVADMIRRRIDELEWRPDLAMPNEGALARELGVSVGTMRKALEMLESEKIISRRRGRGTFVIACSSDSELQRIGGLYALDLVAPARHAVIEKRRRDAEEIECAKMNLPTGASLIEIKRVRAVTDRYRTFETILANAALLGGLEEIDELSDPLLFAIYRTDFHITVETASEQLRPCICDEQIGEYLGISRSAAVLRIERLSWTADDTCVEWSVRYVDVCLP